MENDLNQNQELSRRERRELEKNEQRRQARLVARKKQMKGVFWSFLAVAGVGVFLVLFFQLKTVAEESEPGQKILDQGQRHIAVGAPHEPYNSNPPTSGPHYAQPADWGIYDQPIPEGNFVHSLEHGGVAIFYNDLDEETLANLKNLYRQLEKINGRIILAPYPQLTDAKIALTAWTWLDKLDAYDEDRIRAFFKAHVDQGPEKVPLNAHL